MASIKANKRRWLSATAALPLVAGALTAIAVLPASSAAAATTPGGSSPVPNVHCVGDGVSGKRVQMVYAWEQGQTNRFGERQDAIRLAAYGMQLHVNDSGMRDGQERWTRFVTSNCLNPSQGAQVTIQQVQLPANAPYIGGGDANPWMDTLTSLGLTSNDRIYAIFAENDHVDCGVTTWHGNFDSTPSSNNLQNQRPAWITIVPGCFTPPNLTHEFGHALGALQGGMPHAQNWHCTDGIEAMCLGDQPGTSTVCPHPLNTQIYDCNEDDYFGLNPQGSWLPTHWNAAKDSLYLDHGAAGTAKTHPTLFAPELLKAIDVKGNSIAFSWQPVSTPWGDHTFTLAYDILKDGVVVTTVDGTTHTSGRVSGLTTWSSSSKYTVRARFTYLATGETQTSPESQPLWQNTNGDTSPAGGGLESGVTTYLANDLRDSYGAELVMDDFAASHDEDATIGQFSFKQGDNQRWTPTSAAGGTFTLTNKESNKCLTPRNGATAVGTAIVQHTCDGSAAQRWTFTNVGGSGSVTYNIKTATGTCIGAQANSTDSGAALALATCSPTQPSQRWTIDRMVS
jgi:hypothetical protein